MEIGRRQFGRKFRQYTINIMMEKIIHAKTAVWNLRRDPKRILTKCPLFCVKIGLNAADPIDQRDYFDALADDYTEQSIVCCPVPFENWITLEIAFIRAIGFETLSHVIYSLHAIDSSSVRMM